MLLLTVLPADGRGVPKQVVAWRTGELGQSSDTVTRPSQAGAHQAGAGRHQQRVFVYLFDQHAQLAKLSF